MVIPEIRPFPEIGHNQRVEPYAVPGRRHQRRLSTLSDPATLGTSPAPTIPGPFQLALKDHWEVRSSPVGQGADQDENKNCPDGHTEDEEQSIFYGLVAHVTQLRLLFAQH